MKACTSGMKQVDLVRLLLRKGVVFIRHGANHDWYEDGETENLS